MDNLKQHNTLDDSEKKLALNSYKKINSALNKIKPTKAIDIQIDQEHIMIPKHALEILSLILKAMGNGKSLLLSESSNLLTTQKAAEIIGCSRPHMVKLTREGQVPYSTIGKHRRIKLEDILNYKAELKQKQKQFLIETMHTDEEYGVYNSD